MLFVKNEQAGYVHDMEKEELTTYEQAAEKAWEAISGKIFEMKDSGVSQAEISRRLGVARSVVTGWVKGTTTSSNATFSDMLKYLDVLGLNVRDYLPTCATICRVGKHSPKEAIQGDNLPVVPVFGSTGAGHDVEIFNSEPETFIQVLPQYMMPDLAALRVDGDSMEPTIKCGSYVGVVPFDGMLSEGGIYLVSIPPFGRLIKRIRMGDDGSIILMSDNEKYPEKPIPYEDYDNVVIGRVAWVWQLF